MALTTEILPTAAVRDELARRGGASVSRCYQCATCSSVCELAPDGAPFPRRQMLWAQWGLAERLAGDPALWLCHQCNDCTERCPRDAKPGDVLQSARSIITERLAFPAFLGKLVGNARVTWPLLLAIPTLVWVVLVAGVGGLRVPADLHAYDQLVPHWLIYSVFFPVAAWVLVASWVSGRRYWELVGDKAKRSGSFVGHLVPVLVEVATHRRFGSCGAAKSRRWGHLSLFWGFVGAAVTSGLLVVVMYGFGVQMPLPLMNPIKILGNISALLLVVGGLLLAFDRLFVPRAAGVSTAFDHFFLATVLLVIASGVLVEVGRFLFAPSVALAVYLIHLGVVFTLFITFPYSKFAHLLYRVLAMVHERMEGKAVGASTR